LVQEHSGYVTVPEAARRLNTTPQTIYRWCRAGKLEAIKIGKEWRIPLAQPALRPQSDGLGTLEDVFSSLLGRQEHLLAIAADSGDLTRLESTLVEVGSRQSARLAHAKWGEEEEHIRRGLRPAIIGAREPADGWLELLDVASRYEESGPDGVSDMLVQLINEAQAASVPSCIYGAPLTYFGYHLDKLGTYESELDGRVRGHPALIACGYPLSNVLSVYGKQAISLLIDLRSSHTGVLWYDGQRALLVRP
jgi:excisionase family DNA binding protein